MTQNGYTGNAGVTGVGKCFGVEGQMSYVTCHQTQANISRFNSSQAGQYS